MKLKPPLLWILSIIPLFFLMKLMVQYHVELPYWDEWDLVPLIEKSFSGNLRASDFWALHMEHRMVFPKLLILGLARLTHWNLFVECLFSLGFAVATFSVIGFQINQSQKAICEKNLWLIPAASLFVFSIRQWKNWMMGFNLHLVMGVFFSIAGLIILSQAKLQWKNLFIGAIFGVLAVYSHGVGFAFWGISLGLLCLGEYESQHLKSRALFVWFLMSFAVVGFYFLGFSKPAIHPSLLEGVRQPVAWTQYFFRFLAGALFRGAGAAFAGLWGVILFFIATLKLCREPQKKQASLPFFALGAFVLLNAAIAATTRVGLGIESALASRYVTISYPFWISLLVLLSMLTFDLKWARVTRSFFCALIVVLALRCSWVSQKDYAGAHELMKGLLPAVYALEDEKALGILYYGAPDELKGRVDVLKKHRLSLFR